MSTAPCLELLTAQDTRDKIAQDDLKRATRLAAAIVSAACEASPAEAARWRDMSPAHVAN